MLFSHLINVLAVGSISSHAVRAGPAAVPWVVHGLHAGHPFEAGVWGASRAGFMEALRRMMHRHMSSITSKTGHAGKLMGQNL